MTDERIALAKKAEDALESWSWAEVQQFMTCMVEAKKYGLDIYWDKYNETWECE